jgi:hypothetical protein
VATGCTDLNNPNDQTADWFIGRSKKEKMIGFAGEKRKKEKREKKEEKRKRKKQNHRSNSSSSRSRLTAVRRGREEEE